MLRPRLGFSSFGVIATLALSVSFVLSVFVLPSLLTLWARLTDAAVATHAGRVDRDPVDEVDEKRAS